MKINIISYEDPTEWILGKFAINLNENINKLGIESALTRNCDSGADINHHIIYGGFDLNPSNLDTLMITHIDSLSKAMLLKKQLLYADAGVCMSRDMTEKLVYYGIDKEKLCYVNPAHDSVFNLQPIKIGIATRVYSDGRKREQFLKKLAGDLSSTDYSFKIMGSGWEKYVEILKNEDFEVEYYDQFYYEQYVKLIYSIDLYLYMGLDEGQIGVVDALAAGKEVIVPPVGYHMDIGGKAIKYTFTEYEELLGILTGISENRKKKLRSIISWNWRDYALKHLEIWDYLLFKKQGKHVYRFSEPLNFVDGLNSLGIKNLAGGGENKIEKNRFLIALFRGFVSHLYHKIKNTGTKGLAIKSINRFKNKLRRAIDD